MNFHRNSNGGYTGDSPDHTLTATITKTAPHRGLPAWLVVVDNCGGQIDRAWYGKIADAKWHATVVANRMAKYGGHTRHDDLYPRFDATVSLDHPDGTGGRYL